MIPPLHPTTLADNPKFAALYAHVTTNLLNADGSTKGSPTLQKEREGAEKRLKSEYECTAREELLVEALKGVAGGEGLSEELRQLMRLIISLLTSRTPLSASDIRLLAPSIHAFYAALPALLPHLSAHLQQSHAAITNLAKLSSSIIPPPSTESAPGPQDSLSEIVSVLRTTLDSTQQQLLTSLAALTSQSHTHLHQITTLLSSHIRALELTTHGTHSRFSKARADHLRAVAAAMSAKTSIMKNEALLGLYTPEVREALEGYAGYLDEEVAVLKGREEGLRERIEELDEVRGLDGVAGRVGDVRREIERVKGDIGRLEGGG